MKATLLQQLRREISLSLASAEAALVRLDDALAGETKSSAGDKYETGREMIHQEQQKLAATVAIARENLRLLDTAEGQIDSTTVALGCYVVTTGGRYLIGPGLGKCSVGETTIYCVSVGSPVGQLLIGKGVGDRVELGSRDLTITEIY